MMNERQKEKIKKAVRDVIKAADEVLELLDEPYDEKRLITLVDDYIVPSGMEILDILNIESRFR
jgi:hypothetical protein